VDNGIVELIKVLYICTNKNNIMTLEGMFTKSELDLFNHPKGITENWLDLLIKFEDHKRACNAYGIVGAGVYRTHK
tara:strand:- start:424 stop:651 length:228 start_codon:yes stop_codon:yes gene_type:complete